MSQIEQYQVAASDGSSDLGAQLNNIQMSVQSLQQNGSGLKYEEIDYTTALVALGTKSVFDIPLPTGIGGILIKTILVQGQTSGTAITVSIQTQNTNGRVVYKSSQVTNVLYDMIDLPYKDAANLGELHIVIDNTSSTSVASSFTIIITGIALI